MKKCKGILVIMTADDRPPPKRQRQVKVKSKNLLELHHKDSSCACNYEKARFQFPWSKSGLKETFFGWGGDSKGPLSS